MRPAYTLVELVLVCTFVGLVAGVAVPRVSGTLDTLRLRQARQEVSSALMLGRAAAIRRATFARVVVDEPGGEIRVESDPDTLFRRDLRDLHRVTLRATRDTVTFAPNGLGYGISNSTIVVSIRQRAETVTVSRLGRAVVSRW